MSSFYKDVEVTVTVQYTFTVLEDFSEAMYGVALDALDDTVVRNVETGEDSESLHQMLAEGVYEIRDSKFVVSELQQTKDD